MDPTSLICGYLTTHNWSSPFASSKVRAKIAMSLGLTQSSKNNTKLHGLSSTQEIT